MPVNYADLYHDPIHRRWAQHDAHVRSYRDHDRSAAKHAHSLPVRIAISAYFNPKMHHTCTAGAWTLGGIDILPTLTVEAIPRRRSLGVPSGTLYNIYLQKRIAGTTWQPGLCSREPDGQYNYRRLAMYVFRYAEKVHNKALACDVNSPQDDAREYAALQVQGLVL